MASRETIITALFNALAASASFRTVTRRNRDPEGLAPAETPALILVETFDKWGRGSGYNQLAQREIRLAAMIYNDVGPNDPNAIPSAPVNNAIDAFEALMQPDNWQTETFTLGGLVQACLIDGETQRASGDTTGKALAVVPIRILIP